MSLTKDQINTLIGMIDSVESDELDCDGCFGKMAEFAELHLASREIPEALSAVEKHMQQCPCCKDEFKALLNGLRAIEEI
jgi:hypothetical protein